MVVAKLGQMVDMLQVARSRLGVSGPIDNEFDGDGRIEEGSKLRSGALYGLPGVGMAP